MAAQARNKIVREGEIAVYHCWSRCVQRAFLCGADPYTGRDFSYRREPIERLLEYQASVFAVDLATYNVLSNHMHNATRTRPDIAATWSDEEVACRWKMAWPRWNGTVWVSEPKDEDIRELMLDKKRLANARRGLSSLSWFMARCKEPIARMCNREMGTAGHFWEQRFGCRELIDEAALLTCMVYVDVNQVKAGMASSLEESDHSAIAARLAAWRQREANASHAAFHKGRRNKFELSKEQLESLLADAHLAPICVDGPLMTDASRQHANGNSMATPVTAIADRNAASCDDNGANESGELLDAAASTPAEKSCVDTLPTPLDAINRSIYLRLFGHGRRTRASNNPILAMPFTQYREVVEWVVERGSVSAPSPPDVPEWLTQYLGSREIDPTHWRQAVEHFESWFGRAVGAADGLRELLKKSGDRWIRGIRNCRATFG